MSNYRVCVTRYYTDVVMVDVKADSSFKAKKLAVKAAYKVKPDPRLEATDNGWIADKPVLLQHIGQGIDGPYGLIEVEPGVLVFE